MLRKNSVWIYLVASLFVVLAGCAKPPVEQQTAAQQALSGAETAEAQKYAEAEWTAAQQAMTAAQAELDAQQEKFALTRSYDKAGELIAEAQRAAEAAQQAAVAGKQQAQQQAQDALAATRQALTEAETLLTELGACPRQPKGFSADLEALRANLDTLNQQVPEIETLIASEDYAGAGSRAEALSGEVATLVTDLGNAKTKLGC